MSHQSVSEQRFPRLRKIMSTGTLGLCLERQPVASSLLTENYSAIKWRMYARLMRGDLQQYTDWTTFHRVAAGFYVKAF